MSNPPSSSSFSGSGPAHTFALEFTDKRPAGAAALAADEIDAVPMFQCAESKIYGCDFYGCPAVCKHRFAKQYRHKTLDTKLREQRTVREARALARCHRAGVRVPAVYAVDKRACKIFMEMIPGSTIKDALDAACEEIKRKKKKDSGDSSSTTTTAPAVTRLLHGIGEVVGLLHNHGVIHGDLTTSNFMTMAGTEQPTGAAAVAAAAASSPASADDDLKGRDRDGIVVIDLGLVGDKNTPEERAVDLYVLERAIASTHPFVESYAAATILDGYCRTADPRKGKETLARLEVVRARGRKRSMVG